MGMYLLVTSNDPYELGEEIFFTNDPFHSWDGHINTGILSKDTYGFAIRYRFNAQEDQFKRGMVTLIRY